MQITLKSARVNAGLTLKEACKNIGISYQTLRNYESYKTFPRQSVIKKMEIEYGVEYSDIIFLPK